jgi:hypothetical protein
MTGRGEKRQKRESEVSGILRGAALETTFISQRVKLETPSAAKNTMRRLLLLLNSTSSVSVCAK